ncbi:unnamed protein product [Rhizophagus irregularis]|nr:unnamed protein product [Rhizophagus irregularis]CAB4420271.1 unnamed protein product [Rhizophagus irregularis]
MHTSGVQQKEQIDVSCDDQTIAIIAESSIFKENDCTVIGNNLQTRFKVDIVFLRILIRIILCRAWRYNSHV